MKLHLAKVKQAAFSPSNSFAKIAYAMLSHNNIFA